MRSALHRRSHCTSRLIFFGENSLRRALSQYVEHFHAERNHQGKNNQILFPGPHLEKGRDRPVRCKERLGGLLKYYERQAA